MRLRIFSSRKRRVGSRRSPFLAIRRDASWLDWARSVLSWTMERCLEMRSRRGARWCLRASRRDISPSWAERRASLKTSRNLVLIGCEHSVWIVEKGLTAEHRRELDSFFFRKVQIIPECLKLCSGVFDEEMQILSLELVQS